MTTTLTPHPKNDATTLVPWRAIVAALVGATARLGVVASVGACLFVLLLNEIAAALVYAIAALLGLFLWSC